MNNDQAIRGALTIGLPPGLLVALAATQWGAMPGVVLVLGLVLGAVAGKWISKPNTPETPVLMLPAPTAAPVMPKPTSMNYYAPTFCVFGKRQGVEL